MGSLHRGHSELINAAKKLTFSRPTSVLVSVFVNPLQFGPQEDFKSYPRNFDHDCEISQKAGANAIWAPTTNDVFPTRENSHLMLQAPTKLTKHLCGPHRKGHFDGVVTVMKQLLELISPHILILGEKDWQQLIILRHLIKTFSTQIRVYGVATVRDLDGLAFSSRNSYLSTSEREKAITLPRLMAKTALNAQNKKDINLDKLHAELEHDGLRVEYLEIVDPFTLQPTKAKQNLGLLAAAVHSGSTRLIDHTFLMNHKPIVAIDGPAGAGKSTVTKRFAERLGLLYLDTGAMYRAVAWLIHKEGVNLKQESELRKALEGLKLELENSTSGDQKVLINSNDVTYAIRTPEITSLVSTVAAQAAVREALTAQQKEIGKLGGIVAEGRDIGTAVFPNAELKIFLTASSEERARRRAADLNQRGFPAPSLKELEAQIKERDKIDSTREISPLIIAKDAIEVITDEMTIEDVIEALIELFRLKVPDEVWTTF